MSCNEWEDLAVGVQFLCSTTIGELKGVVWGLKKNCVSIGTILKMKYNLYLSIKPLAHPPPQRFSLVLQ